MNVEEATSVEDEDGCVVRTEMVDGDQVEVHHRIPDDSAPHAPTSECGCRPEVFHARDGIRVYLHVDQDRAEQDWDGDDDFP